MLRQRCSLVRLLLAAASLYLAAFVFFRLPSFSKRHSSVSLPADMDIDQVINGYYNYDAGPLQYLPRSCRPSRDVAFIKCMKCATETLGSVFRRYAYTHDLAVVLPVDKRIYLGWPYQMTDRDYRPSPSRFNVLMEHAVYNGSSMRRIMNPATPFVTMIREPLDHFVSTLNYFNVFAIANVSLQHGMKAVQTYLRDIQRYESVYKSAAASPKRYCIPDGFSVTKNLLAHCLGMKLGFPEGTESLAENGEAVMRYVAQLDSELTLVMLMEYFPESLVLLRRALCWDTKDIVYYSTNQGAYRQELSWHVLTPYDRQLHREWSKVDYLLYSFFNRTFWHKVALAGDDFRQEVQHFRDVQRQVTWFCNNVVAYGESFIRFGESLWSPPFTFTSGDCKLMASPLLKMLQERHDQRHPELKGFPKAAPRRFQPLC